MNLLSLLKWIESIPLTQHVTFKINALRQRENIYPNGFTYAGVTWLENIVSVSIKQTFNNHNWNIKLIKEKIQWWLDHEYDTDCLLISKSRGSLSYDNRNTHSYETQVITTNGIIDTQTGNTNLRVTPADIDDIYDNLTMNTNGMIPWPSNELIEQQFWNQDYGMNTQNNPQPEYYHQNNNNDAYFYNPYYGFNSGNADQYYYDDVYDDTKIEVTGHVEIQLEAEIGKGRYSTVFKARWRKIEVAAKRFILLGVTKKKAKEYIDNYAIKVNKEPHENVIKILAIANKPVTLLTEYMNKGSVKNYVRSSRPGSTSISILDRIKIALQAAKGIAHLHKLGIIHSEITSANLLMELKTTNNKGNRNDIRVVITDYALQSMLTGDGLDAYRSYLG
eukprot:37298_1